MGNRANIVLMDRDGWQLRYSHWAGCRMLDALLAGRPVAASQKPSIGCNIKWKPGNEPDYFG